MVKGGTRIEAIPSYTYEKLELVNKAGSLMRVDSHPCLWYHRFLPLPFKRFSNELPGEEWRRGRKAQISVMDLSKKSGNSAVMTGVVGGACVAVCSI